MAQLGLQLVVSEAEILQLVSEREAYRQARDFARSDAIRDQLRTMGVELYDKEREWRCRDGRRGFLFTAGPSMCTLSDMQIQDRVNQREEARATKNWALADSFRDELRNQGVELDDKARTWRTASGRSGTYGNQVQHGSALLSEVEIRSMVADRERARAMQDFATADELRRRLVAMGVEVYDKERIWRASDGRQGTIISGGVDPIQCSLSEADIVFRIALREDARAQKDWQRADHLRDELRLLGVELIDPEQQWRTADGRTGFYMPTEGASVGNSEHRDWQQQSEPHTQQWPTADGRSSSYIPMETAAIGSAEYGNWQQQSEPQLQQWQFSNGPSEYGDWQQQSETNMQQWPAPDEKTSVLLGDAASDPAAAAEMQRQWQVFNASLGTPPLKAMPQSALSQPPAAPSPPPVAEPFVQPAVQVPGPPQVLTQQPQSFDQGYHSSGHQSSTVYRPTSGHRQQHAYGNAVGSPPVAMPATSQHAYGADTSSGIASVLSDHSIQALVVGREAVREHRNFEAADAIREDLKQHGVEIWDKQRCWKASDGRRGNILSADTQFQRTLAFEIAQGAPVGNGSGIMRSHPY